MRACELGDAGGVDLTVTNMYWLCPSAPVLRSLKRGSPHGLRLMARPGASKEQQNWKHSTQQERTGRRRGLGLAVLKLTEREGERKIDRELERAR